MSDLKPAMSAQYGGQLYQVRQKGRQPRLASGSHLERNGKDSFADVKPLYVDPEYEGDSPEYWMVGSRIFSGSYSREQLEQKHPDEEIKALRFRDDIEQRTLQEVVA